MTSNDVLGEKSLRNLTISSHATMVLLAVLVLTCAVIYIVVLIKKGCNDRRVDVSREPMVEGRIEDPGTSHVVDVPHEETVERGIGNCSANDTVGFPHEPTTERDCSDYDFQLIWAYERIETKGAQQHSNVQGILHDLKVLLDNHVADDPNSSSSQSKQTGASSRNLSMSARIKLCSILQECHDVCVTKLKEACKEAVTLFLKDPSHPFPQEVKFCMNDAFSIELRSAPDKSVHEARHVMCVVTKFHPQLELTSSDKKKYSAVYALVTSYLEKGCCSDFKDLVLEEITMNNPAWTSKFATKIVPTCWELVTMYKPPVFLCCHDQRQFDPNCHDRHPISKERKRFIKYYTFPLVYRDYRGAGVYKRAVVIT